MSDLASLLHDAAVAAGIDPETPGWRPHEDGNQSMALADAVRAMVSFTDNTVVVFAGPLMAMTHATVQFREGRDRMAVARYAVLRAAAAVGRGMAA